LVLNSKKHVRFYFIAKAKEKNFFDSQRRGKQMRSAPLPVESENKSGSPGEGMGIKKGGLICNPSVGGDSCEARRP